MLRRRFEPKALIRLGMLFLLLASLSRWFAHPTPRVSEGVIDGLVGMLYGVSISLMLLGLYLNRRRRSAS